MESKNELNLDVIGIDTIVHMRDIVAVNATLLHEINMSINKDGYLNFDDNSHSNSCIINDDIDTHEWDDDYRKEFNTCL